MISRCLFVCLYLFSFFLINRWYDLYHYYFDQSTGSLFSHRSIPTDQLTIKQLQYILNLRGVSYVHANEKYDLVRLVEQTGNSPMDGDEIDLFSPSARIGRRERIQSTD